MAQKIDPVKSERARESKERLSLYKPHPNSLMARVTRNKDLRERYRQWKRDYEIDLAIREGQLNPRRSGNQSFMSQR